MCELPPFSSFLSHAHNNKKKKPDPRPEAATEALVRVAEAQLMLENAKERSRLALSSSMTQMHQTLFMSPFVQRMCDSAFVVVRDDIDPQVHVLSDDDYRSLSSTPVVRDMFRIKFIKKVSFTATAVCSVSPDSGAIDCMAELIISKGQERHSFFSEPGCLLLLGLLGASEEELASVSAPQRMVIRSVFISLLTCYLHHWTKLMNDYTQVDCPRHLVSQSWGHIMAMLISVGSESI